MKEEKYANLGASIEGERQKIAAELAFAESQAKELAKAEKYKRMVSLADSIGPRQFFEREGDYIGFDDWGEALGFKDICDEAKFPVKIVDPPKNILAGSVSYFFRVYPE